MAHPVAVSGEVPHRRGEPDELGADDTRLAVERLGESFGDGVRDATPTGHLFRQDGDADARLHGEFDLRPLPEEMVNCCRVQQKPGRTALPWSGHVSRHNQT